MALAAFDVHAQDRHVVEALLLVGVDADDDALAALDLALEAR